MLHQSPLSLSASKVRWDEDDEVTRTLALLSGEFSLDTLLAYVSDGIVGAPYRPKELAYVTRRVQTKFVEFFLASHKTSLEPHYWLVRGLKYHPNPQEEVWHIAQKIVVVVTHDNVNINLPPIAEEWFS